MAISKIVSRVYDRRNGEENIYFFLDNGLKLTEKQAIDGVKNKTIYNARVEYRQGKEIIKAKDGYNIKTRYLNPKKEKIPLNKYKLPFDTVEPVKQSGMYFERDLYSELLDWKKDGEIMSTKTVLFLRGSRQVGKTFLLKDFGKREFKNFIYINLRNKKTKKRFLDIIEFVNNRVQGDSEEFENLFWKNVFKIYDDSFEDTKETLIFIDEIQDSSVVFNYIRSINRSLNARFCISGSFIGLTQLKSDYKLTAGDCSYFTLNSLSFIEFLKAVGIYKEYSKIMEIDKKKLQKQEIEIYNKVEELYNVYMKIGGYPAVVKTYLETKSIDKALIKVEGLLKDFYEESKGYLYNILDISYLPTILNLTVFDLIRRANKLQGNQSLTIKDKVSVDINRKDKNNCLGWLEISHIIDKCPIYTDIDNLFITTEFKYYLSDMGMLYNICRKEIGLSESDVKGVLSENFVFLYLRDNLNKINNSNWILNSELKTFNGNLNGIKGEIDFIVYNSKREKIAIEVKYHKGVVKSADLALQKKYVDGVVKIMNTFGSVENDKTIIPIFAIDKMKYFSPFI